MENFQDKTSSDNDDEELSPPSTPEPSDTESDSDVPLKKLAVKKEIEIQVANNIKKEDVEKD